MAHPDDPQPHAAFASGGLSEHTLRRYLPSDLVTTLLRDDCPSRIRVETFVQLASTRYAISTYLPRHLVARQLATTDSGPWIEWVEGSLLFADVSGSTALAERLSALGREGTEIVTGMLNDFFGAMLQIIEAAGGDLLTFGGDALLVLFRGPQHAHIATQAALDLLRTCGNDPAGRPLFQRSTPAGGTFSLSMHIGVESGRVALASAGQPAALRYSALGSTINSVARAEGYGGRGELVVGPNTWAAIAADAEGRPVAEGYVRVHALRTTSLPPALLPHDEPISEPPEQALARIVHQLDRISPYLPTGLLSRILVDPQRSLIEADLRPVTVLFAQVVGLGPLVEALPARQAADLLDGFLRPMQAAIESFGGVVNKLDLAEEGDKLLAIFGAPVAYEDHAERAARAALEMHETLASLDLGSLCSPGVQSSIAMRIGLNTGIVFAGNVGTATRKEYTVMGDAVNVAARVMARAAWGETWCSESAAARIAPRLVCEDRGRVAVKGKSEPLQVLRLVGEREQPPVFETDDTPLVGRQAEFAWLRGQLEAVRAGQGRVVRMSGEAGVGKSRLAVALIEQARLAGMRVMLVNCLSYATNIPYAPWSEWLKCLCDIEAGDTQAVRAAKLRARLAALGEEACEWLPLLADLVRLGEVADTVVTRALDPQQRQLRRFELLTDLLRSAAVPRRAGTGRHAADAPPASLSPILVVFEDLHWADQVSLDLWRHMAARSAEVPVLLLGVHRPQLDWGNAVPHGDGAHLLTLGELSLQESEALLAARLNGKHLPALVRNQIVTRAAGNPLFLEELLRAVMGDGRPAGVNGNGGRHAQASARSLEELPDSLHGLLLSRIDRLDEHSRSILRVASVIGQRFPFGVLHSIHPSDQRALLAHLSTLDEAKITLLERELPDRVHIFRHALMQEVAYQSLLYARRRELHRRIGEYLERQHAHDMKPFYDLLAHHYRLSDRQDKAVTYLLLAGRAARDTYANDEAIQYYRWALEALHADPANPRTWEAREALGDVLCTVGRYDEALAEYAAILGEGDAGDERGVLPPAVAAEALRSRGNALEKQGQYAAALEALDRAEALVRTHLDDVPPLLLPLICADRGAVLMRWGEYDQALRVCMEGLGKLRRDGRTREDERIEASLHSHIGTIHGMRGDYAQARFHFESALAAQEASDNLYGSSILHNNIGYLWQLQSEYERAIMHYERAEALARKINARYVLSGAYLNLAYAYYCLGRYDRAEAGCYAALPLCEEMRDQPGIAHIYDTLGLIAYNRGNYDQALASYNQALMLYRELDSSYQEGNTLANTARVYTARAQLDQARTVAQQAFAIAERLQAPQLKVEALNALAEADLVAADMLDEHSAAPVLGRCAERAEHAATLALELGSRLDYGIARRLLGQVAARMGQSYAEHFQDSSAIFAEIKNRFELAYTQVRYAEALVAHDAETAMGYLKQAQQTFKDIGADGELQRLDYLSERSV